jgi:hypothetical protein
MSFEKQKLLTVLDNKRRQKQTDKVNGALKQSPINSTFKPYYLAGSNRYITILLGKTWPFELATRNGIQLHQAHSFSSLS